MTTVGRGRKVVAKDEPIIVSPARDTLSSIYPRFLILSVRHGRCSAPYGELREDTSALRPMEIADSRFDGSTRDYMPYSARAFFPFLDHDMAVSPHVR
jgi:hypothetical protein